MSYQANNGTKVPYKNGNEMSVNTKNDATAVEATENVAYNSFAGKLAEGLEIVGFKFKDSDGRIETWEIAKNHGNIEVSIDYISGETFIEISGIHGKVTKSQTVWLRSTNDLYTVVKAAQ